ncbi:MAG: response regulator [bacterium]
MKILVIDDDSKLRNEIESILTRNGHSVDCAACASYGVTMVAKDRYDVVLLDYWMPEHNGLWFLENAVLPRQTKTLLMTSYSGRRFVKRIFDAGVTDFVPKPFDEAELLLHLEFLSKEPESVSAQAAPIAHGRRYDDPRG